MSAADAVRAFIAVGSNIDPEGNIPAALDRLTEEVEVAAVSTFYRTAALGRPEQPPFTNGVWQVSTDMAPRLLKNDVLRPIEKALGRVRTRDRYAARPIDLDIALYGDLVISEEDLVIPDPDIRERPFLVIPLLELAPDLCMPDTGERLASLPAARQTGGLEPMAEFTELLRGRMRP
jgi:2-amino-4-hydroxy-6-hydroxymethyldihydropteridine diphosphokinase